MDIGAYEWDGTPSSIVPAVVRIDGANGNDGNDGSSWPLARKTVQSAIDLAAILGGDVWVKAGTYYGQVTLKPFASIYGGFTGAETSKDARDWTKNTTILDGKNTGSAVIASNIGPGMATIDGFTIQNGSTTGNGGGVSCSYFGGTISNNTIRMNSAVYGGGIYCYFSPAIISRNAIANNSAASGGGIYSSTSASIIVNNTISANTATNAGGGGGGAIACVAMPPTPLVNTISDNTIVGNTSASVGGGISCSSLAASAIANNIVAFNSSGISGYSITLRNNCVFNPGGKDYRGGKSAGIGDISRDPLFANRFAGDYHLRPASPCINAGWNDAAGIPAADMDGEARLNGTIDIGADEYWPGTARSVADTKAAGGGSAVDLYGGIVTAAFADSFYVEADDRASGMLVKKPGHTLQAGNRARIVGSLAAESDPERCIEAAVADPMGTGSVSALAMPNKSVGGGTCGLQGGVWGWITTTDANGEPTRAWDQVKGLSNIGLLIATSGRVTGFEHVDDPAKPTWFTIDDGSGLNLKCSVPSGVTINPAWQYVRVTGVSSCERVGTELHAVVRVRTQGDVVGF